MKRVKAGSSTEGTKPKKPKIQRKWRFQEEDLVLDYLISTIQLGKVIEKPTADKYYERMSNTIKIPNCTPGQIKGKVKNLKDIYTQTNKWRGETGQGVREEQGEATFEQATLSRCPHFRKLDEVFGGKTNINPPFLLEAGTLKESIMASEQSNEVLAQPGDIHIVIEDGALSPPPEASINCQLTRHTTKTGRYGLGALTEARNRKTELDLRKLEMEEKRLEFEKQKLASDSDIREKQHALEEKRVNAELELKKYEIELKYKTQYQIARLNFDM